MNKKTVIFLLSSFAWSAMIGLVLWHFQIRFNTLSGLFILAFLYMLFPAAITLYLHGFNWQEMVQDYGLDLQTLQYKNIAITCILYLFSLYLVFFLLNSFFHEVFHFSDLGHIALQKEEVMREAARITPINNPEDFPEIYELVLFGVIGSIIAGFTVNLVFALGEEIGWRGFMQKELSRFGFYPSAITSGILWGIWHAPVLLQGFQYPDSSVTASVFYMIILSVVLNIPFTDFRIKTKSVITPAILHGMFNASGMLSVLLIGEKFPWGGIMGVAGWVTILVAWRLTNELRKFFPGTIKSGKNLLHICGNRLDIF